MQLLKQQMIFCSDTAQFPLLLYALYFNLPIKVICTCKIAKSKYHSDGTTIHYLLNENRFLFAAVNAVHSWYLLKGWLNNINQVF